MRNFYTSFTRKALLAALLAAFGMSGLAQGTIRGNVLDAEFSDVLIGATVLIEGTQRGANSDLDGNFSIEGVAAGSYTLVFTYLGYKKITVTDVVVKDGEVTVVNVVMETEGTTVDEVVITAKQLEISEASLLNVQFKSSNTLDGLGSRQMGRIGDSDAGGAIKRVVGVTVEGGKYVYVRGLGDRYMKTLVNGAEIPGLDPTRNSVQIDLFPTNVIDNLLIYKSFTPDLPGDFTGGLVDIATRDFPDQYRLSISVSGSYNTQATFNNDFLTYDGSSTDFLGFGFNDRNLPANFEQTVTSLNSVAARAANPDLVNSTTNSIRNQWVPIREGAPLDHSLTFSLGNQTKLFGKQFGYVVGISYRRQYTYLDGTSGYFLRQDVGSTELFQVYDFNKDQSGIDEVLWSALVNLSIKLNDRNKLSLNLMRTQSGTQTTRFLDGRANEGISTVRYREVRNLDYNQRSNSIVQLRGEHQFGADDRWNVDWILSGALTQNLQPDFRTWGVQYDLDEATGVRSNYILEQTTVGDPIRFFRELDETNFDSKFHITYNFTDWTGAKAKFKFGGGYLNRVGRKFTERQFNYQSDAINNADPRAIASFVDNYDAFFAPSNNFYQASPSVQGFYYTFLDQFVNDYTADADVISGYAMVDLNLSKKLRFVGGGRVETTNIVVEPDDPSSALGFDGTVDQVDFLPGLSLIFATSEKSNLRINGSRTIARPVFREIAPFFQFDFVGGYATVGNDSLDRSLSTNLDVRYEFFPKPTEVFAISAYYKLLDEPIEKAQQRNVPNAADNPVVTWQNVDKGFVMGLEVDFRKDLEFISEKLKRFRFAFNGSVTYSEVDVPQSEIAQGIVTDPGFKDTRPLFGQSPYVVNASLAYSHEETGTTYTVAFNQFGERLILVAFPGTPNYFEQPRASLDINVLQKIGGADGRWTLRLGAQNILNATTRWTSEFNGQEYDWLNYKEGVRLTVGVNYSFTR